MPCNMFGDSTSGDFAYQDAKEAKKQAEVAMKKANEVTDILCSLLRHLPSEFVETLD
jgi:hypothetical protein